MWPPWPHIAVIVYYTYKLSYFHLGSSWLHISYCFYLSIYGFDLYWRTRRQLPTQKCRTCRPTIRRQNRGRRRRPSRMTLYRRIRWTCLAASSGPRLPRRPFPKDELPCVRVSGHQPNGVILPCPRPALDFCRSDSKLCPRGRSLVSIALLSAAHGLPVADPESREVVVVVSRFSSWVRM